MMVESRMSVWVAVKHVSVVMWWCGAALINYPPPPCTPSPS